jgi:hypothetical protein
MCDATYNTDILTLTHGLKLKNLLTSVGILLTLEGKCQ